MGFTFPDLPESAITRGVFDSITCGWVKWTFLITTLCDGVHVQCTGSNYYYQFNIKLLLINTNSLLCSFGSGFGSGAVPAHHSKRKRRFLLYVCTSTYVYICVCVCVDIHIFLWCYSDRSLTCLTCPPLRRSISATPAHAVATRGTTHAPSRLLDSPNFGFSI